MAYHRCRYRGSQSPYLFEYTNVVIASASDCIVTDVNWNEATFSGKKWQLEFSLSRINSSSSREAIIGTSTDNINFLFRSSRLSQRISTSNYNIGNSLNASSDINKDIILQYDGTKYNLSVGGSSKGSLNPANPSYASGSNTNKIIIGKRPDGNWLYTGTINYIRLKFID